MKYLIVSNFEPDPNAGAAGALHATQNALTRRGHQVDVLWRRRGTRLVPNHAFSELLELPSLQLRQVEAQLQLQHYDAVDISQPFAYRVYETLAPRFPRTLFLNRTHGWEARVHACDHRWVRPGPMWRRVASGVKKHLALRACQRTAAAAHGIITACTKCAAFVRTAYQLDASRVDTIAHGVAHELLGVTDTPPPRVRQRMLYVGGLLPMKGAQVLRTLLPDIAQEFPDATVTFVIPNDQIGLVEGAFRSSFGDRLGVLSWRDRSELADIYAAHDLLLMPSLFEGFHKASLEAMAMGLCVVGFDEGGLADMAVHGEDALFCAPGDLDAYAALLRRALSQPALVTAIGQRARRLGATYTWDRAAERLEGFVHRVRADVRNTTRL